MRIFARTFFPNNHFFVVCWWFRFVLFLFCRRCSFFGLVGDVCSLFFGFVSFFLSFLFFSFFFSTNLCSSIQLSCFFFFRVSRWSSPKWTMVLAPKSEAWFRSSIENTPRPAHLNTLSAHPHHRQCPRTHTHTPAHNHTHNDRTGVASNTARTRDDCSTCTDHKRAVAAPQTILSQ